MADAGALSQPKLLGLLPVLWQTIVRLAPALFLPLACMIAPPASSQPGGFERVPEIPVSLGIVQDAEGYMWFATLFGLYRYDGYNVRIFTYDAADSTSISSSRTSCLYLDDEGVLWVGTSPRGLNRLDRKAGVFTRYDHDPDDPHSLSHSWVTTMTQDRYGDLWVGTVNGLNRLDRRTGRFTRYFHNPEDPFSLSDNNVWALHEDRSGTIWVGTVKTGPGGPSLGGLNEFDRRTGTFRRYMPDPDHAQFPRRNDIRSIHEDTRGNLWVGTRSGDLFAMDRRTRSFRHFPIPEHPDWPRQPQQGADSVFAGTKVLHEDVDGHLWIGVTFRGLYSMDSTGVVAPFPRNRQNPTGLGNNLRDDGFESIYQSRDEVLWISAWDGVYRRHKYPGTLPLYQIGPGEFDPRNVVNSVYEDATGAIWIGTRAGGLCKYDRRRGLVRRYLHDEANPNSLRHDWVWTVYGDRFGRMWIGTAAGLDRFDPVAETFEHIPFGGSQSPASDQRLVSAVHEDHSGTLWIATRAGLMRYEPTSNTYERYRGESGGPNSLSTEWTMAIHESRDGFLWVGTIGGGFNQIDPTTGHVEWYMPAPGENDRLSDISVTAIYEDAEGILWIGTEAGGLNRYHRESDTFTHFTLQNGRLPDTFVTAIQGDDQGNLWVRMRLGLVRFNTRDFSVKRYVADVGPWMSGISHKSPSGELFFGAQDGFYAFHPDDLQSDPHPPDIVLTGFRLIGTRDPSETVEARSRPLADLREIRVPHDQNSFVFDYVGMHYGEPEKIQYAFILEGLESEWRDAGTQRSATYVRVPPGTYTFRARAANADGVWNQQGASITLIVLPPWWRTWWAYAIYALIFIVGVVATRRFEQRRLLGKERAEAAIRESDLRARALEADNRRQAVELEKARELEAVNAELRAHRARLEEQNVRLAELDETKSRFFANISHEFRTPLTLILAPVADAIAGTRPLDAPRLGIIHRNARRLLHLINQLLDLSKIEAGGMRLKLGRADVVAFLRGIVLTFAARAEREHVLLRFEAASQTISAAFDAEKLEKVVFNLLSNALKFTDAGGEVVMRVRKAHDADGEAVELSVKDNGPGIPPEELPRIFDRFHQVDASSTRRHEGTGIGLALTKELVELHGGAISVESTVGVGTTFLVQLPIHEADVDLESTEAPDQSADEDGRFWLVDGDVGVAEPVASESSARDAAPTVLIVEDNADVRSYLRDQLGEDYRVVEARDGAEGLARARSERPDLVISDVMMPGMDGLALCRAIKTDPELNHVPVVLLTARADEASRLEGLEHRADDYLTKPFSAEELLYRVENLIELRRILRSRFSREVVIEPSRMVVSSEKAVFLERLQQVVESRLEDPSFDVGQLADEMNLSSRHLQRRLRELGQPSAAGFIRMTRLHRAAQLLEQEAGQVQEVAYAVGFHDPKHFATLFRQVFGTPPSSYSAQR